MPSELAKDLAADLRIGQTAPSLSCCSCQEWCLPRSFEPVVAASHISTAQYNILGCCLGQSNDQLNAGRRHMISQHCRKLGCMLCRRLKIDCANCREEENYKHLDTGQTNLPTSAISVIRCDAKRSGGMIPAPSRQIYSLQFVIHKFSGLCAS
jgi:hypothetical protein